MSYIAANRGVVSTVNSSTSTLGISGVFTGTSEDVKDYSNITVFVDSDTDGTLSMQLSSDGTNWDRAKVVVVDQTISTGSVHTLEVVCQYFRIVYTNGSTGQTHFRLQTLYHTAKSNFLTSSPDEVISKINDAQLMRISNEPFFDISRSLYADKIAIHKFGGNNSSPSGTLRDIWNYGDTTRGNINYNWLEAAVTVRVKSGGNINDDVAGTGAQKVMVEGLDENWDQASEEITLSGISASSATTITFIRVFRMYVTDCGTYTSSNDGDIIVETTGAGNPVVCSINSGFGQSKLSMYSIPAGYTGYLKYIEVNAAAGTNKDATIVLCKRENADDVTTPFSGMRLMAEWPNLQGSAETTLHSLQTIPEKSDIWGAATGSAITGVSMLYDLILVKGDSPTNPQ